MVGRVDLESRKPLSQRQAEAADAEENPHLACPAHFRGTQKQSLELVADVVRYLNAREWPFVMVCCGHHIAKQKWQLIVMFQKWVNDKYHQGGEVEEAEIGSRFFSGSSSCSSSGCPPETVVTLNPSSGALVADAGTGRGPDGVVDEAEDGAYQAEHRVALPENCGLIRRFYYKLASAVVGADHKEEEEEKETRGPYQSLEAPIVKMKEQPSELEKMEERVTGLERLPDLMGEADFEELGEVLYLLHTKADYGRYKRAYNRLAKMLRNARQDAPSVQGRSTTWGAEIMSATLT
ncbi:hypothetical protein BJY01DRAFT_255752 [Aspergillus pseudoustus]|uniref:Uncharacterized protein n=1 Tax=Aspergillus pseudoustus TaxID=1810923 RepID=A0ABR4IHQ2_9EURO